MSAPVAVVLDPDAFRREVAAAVAEALRAERREAAAAGLLSLREAALRSHRRESTVRAALEAGEVQGAVFRPAAPGQRGQWLIPATAIEAWALASARG